MSIYPHAVEALADAKALADMGVPIFTARLKPNGDPIPPNGWEKTRPSSAPANRYRSSNTSGLCALTGILYDVIDIDPRNGGDKSIQRLSSELGDNGPEVYWRVKTPSGGQHLYIACLGIGSHNGFMPGLDLKGGKKDGSSRGFVFLPPTVRPSKVTGKPSAYQRIGDGPSDADTVRCSALADFIEKQISERNSSSAGGAFRRNEPSSLRQACLDAEAGEQREALLRYVHELERRGYEDSDIVTVILGLTMEMPTYDVNRPWTERHIRGLLHHSGRVLPDALPDELAGIEGPITAGLVQNMAGLEPERVSWIWRKYLAFRELTLLDGEKGQGKSFIVDDWASIASRGDCFPGSPDEKIEPINVIIFTDEGHLESTTLPRLIAANANRDRIYTPRIKKPKRGKVEVWDLALPDGAVIMERMIKEAGAQLAIWDPITDFLDESVNSHNDASVRRALRPLNGILNRTNCAGLAIRHLNKNTQQEARFRGGGSVAFANRARVHLIAAKLPMGASPEGGMFGVGMLEVNIAKKIDDVLAYSIVDSHVFADDAGNAVGKVEWHGYCGVKAEDLGKQHAAKGPTPVVQDEIISVLNQMFSERDVWDADEAKKALTDAGINANKETVVKARKRVGIIARARFISGRIDGWDWKIQAKESTNRRGAPR